MRRAMASAWASSLAKWSLTPEVRALLPALRAEAGIVVAAGSATGPYWQDALQPGDVVYSLNGQETRTIGALRSAVGALRSGDAAVFHVNRRGRRYYVGFLMD